jgi:hypothetical protein
VRFSRSSNDEQFYVAVSKYDEQNHGKSKSEQQQQFLLQKSEKAFLAKLKQRPRKRLRKERR